MSLPLLFLFINELTKDIESGKHGIQLAPDLIELLILLFADDVVLLSDSDIGLQTQLNVLYNTAKRLDLIVNLDKPNILVFKSTKSTWVYHKAHVLIYSNRPCRSNQKGNARNYETFMVCWWAFTWNLFFQCSISRYSLFWLVVPKYGDCQTTRKVSKEYTY